MCQYFRFLTENLLTLVSPQPDGCCSCGCWKSQQISCHVMAGHVFTIFADKSRVHAQNGNGDILGLEDALPLPWNQTNLLVYWFFIELWPIFKTPFWGEKCSVLYWRWWARASLKPRGWYNILKNLLSGWKTRFPTCWWVWWTDDYSMLMGDWAAGGFHEWNISISRDNFGLYIVYQKGLLFLAR